MRYLDYAVVIVMAVFIFASISWLVSARKWFTGPITNVDDEDSPSGTYEEKTGSNALLSK